MQRCSEPLEETRGRAFKVLRSRTRDAGEMAGEARGGRQECVARDCLSRISVSPESAGLGRVSSVSRD